MGHTKERQVESSSVRRNDSSLTTEEELTEEKREESRANAKSSSKAAHKGWKLMLIGKFVKLKCGRQLCSTNKDVASSINPPTLSIKFGATVASAIYGIIKSEF